MYDAQTHAEAVTLTDTTIDRYAQRGVAITRDAASVVMAALRRDSYEMRARGGSANNDAADTADALAMAILHELMRAPNSEVTYCEGCGYRYGHRISCRLVK